ncbi:nicotinamidase [Dongshaea marina]|uniref:nicotinamidase n=1 Tax=Dongshaea marina TaxID=2047966 RepID=UPI000D3E9B42|nr:nicotinamidase [Dongshaea marina]
MIASFDVDAQKGFTLLCPKELPVPGGTEIVDALNEQASLAHYRVASKDAHPANALWQVNDVKDMLRPLDYPHTDLTWPSHCVAGSYGFELLDGLPHPSDYDFFVWKGVEPDMHPYGACYHDLAEQRSTGMIEFLRQHGILQVIVGGLATDYCVKVTALQLADAGFEVIVNLSACRGIAPETTEQAKQQMHEKGIHLAEDLCQVKRYLGLAVEPERAV